MLSKVVKYNLEQYERAMTGGNSKGVFNTYVVPFIQGPPGCGKTSLPRQVAAQFEIPYSQTIIAQYDAGEMAGFPAVINREYPVLDDEGTHVGRKIVQRMGRIRPDYLPDIDNPDMEVGIYNLDEMPQAFLANLNICSQIVNEWRVGEHSISPGITICATGNRAEDKAGTTSLPMHLRDRLTYFTLEPNADDFLQYAVENRLDRRVRAYIRARPDKLFALKPGMDAGPTPRSWEKVSAWLSMDWKDNETGTRLESLTGQIGAEATEFEAWIRVESKMPDWRDIVAKPKEAPVFGAKESDILYMLISTLADQVNDKNIEAILTYIDRLPNKEFAALWANETLTMHRALSTNKHFQKWKINVATKMVI
jgi:MoxR-like ATPase